MLCDHLNALWFHLSQPWMLLVGRATYPLFAYAVACALLRADAARAARYIVRLLVLAALVQPVYQLCADWPTANVIFTLAAGAAFAAVAERARPWHMYLLFAAGALSMFFLPNRLEFGLAGALLPAAILLALRGEKFSGLFLLLLLFALNPLRHLVGLPLLGLAAAGLPLLVLGIARDLPQDGRWLPKYALHVFYPGHIFLLWLTARLFF